MCVAETEGYAVGYSSSFNERNGKKYIRIYAPEAFNTANIVQKYDKQNKWKAFVNALCRCYLSLLFMDAMDNMRHKSDCIITKVTHEY